MSHKMYFVQLKERHWCLYVLSNKLIKTMFEEADVRFV